MPPTARLTPAALLAALLLPLVGCGASAGPWAIMTPTAAPSAERQLRAQLRSAGSEGSSASDSDVSVESGAIAYAPSPSSGGLFGGGSGAPPPPSAWDAPPPEPQPDLAAEMRARLAPGPSSDEERPRYAENGVRPDGSAATASDGTSQPLLVYTAQLGMAVHQVATQQERVQAIAAEAGGHLDSRTDDAIVVRVPAGAFDRVIAAIRELGTVVTQNVDVQDVTATFRDTQLRIRTLEAMRARVEQLLAEATSVEAALAVEQHLERITVELESLRGQMRLLADQIALSTITVRFAERTGERAQEFQLPFRWLHTLGLQTLMAL